MSSTTLHVRAETKPLEHRTAITPTIAKKLVDASYNVNVERSSLSIFDDSEYETTGATLVPTGSWIDAPGEDFIIGLKELPEEDFPLKHTVRLRLSVQLIILEKWRLQPIPNSMPSPKQLKSRSLSLLTSPVKPYLSLESTVAALAFILLKHL